jgi:RNA polymerase sigma factor (sigma-70 family)
MRQEHELIRDCQNGDASARMELYDCFSPRLWVVCLRFARNHMIAEDLFQEGFIRIFENLPSYQGQGSFEGWLRRIMVNTAINFYKKHKRHISDAEFQGNSIEGSYSGGALEQLSIDEMMRMVRNLPESQSIVFNLFAIEGYSHKEIADLLDISENTSKSRMLRARLSLQAMIEKEYKEVYTYEKQRRI